MFKKVLEYAGEYRKTTYASMAVMLIGIVMNVLPFFFLYQLIAPLLLGQSVGAWYVVWRVLAIGACGVLYALLYVKGLLQTPQKPAFFPSGKAGAPAFGNHSGEGCGNPKKDVY